jgi:DNA polymerase III gamma/tau subunit
VCAFVSLFPYIWPFSPPFISSALVLLSDKLKKRVNKRLKKLAKWSDSSPEERQAEFRQIFNRGYSSSSSYSRVAPYQPSSSSSSSLQYNRPVAPSATNASMVRPPMTIGGFTTPHLQTVTTAAASSSSLPPPSLQQQRMVQLQQQQQQPSSAVSSSSSAVSVGNEPITPVKSAVLDSVRNQLQQELKAKDSQREDLINQLQSELKQETVSETGMNEEKSKEPTSSVTEKVNSALAMPIDYHLKNKEDDGSNYF